MYKKYLESFVEYILRHHRPNLLDILKQPLITQSFSVIIDFFTLFEEEIELGSSLLTDPDGTLAVFDEALVVAQQRIIIQDQNDTPLCTDSLISSSNITIVDSELSDKRECSASYSLKNLIHARVTGLPANIQDGHKSLFPNNDDLGLFVQISGNVVRVTLPCLQEYERSYLCVKCGTKQSKQAEYELDNALLPPYKCISGCPNPKFTHVKEEGKELLKDYQEIRIQEELGKMHLGSVPSSIWATLDHDLVDVCHPGEHVTIWGTVKRRWKNWKPGTQPDVEIVLKANNVQVTNHQKAAKLVTQEVKEKIQNFWSMYKHNPLQGRDVILASFCPDLYGVYVAKLALVVVLCGGSECEENRVRSQPHLLLVGDPGTGKSHLLRFAAKVASRSVITTGVGSTTAGLTVCAVREGGDWQLEAGALVLADGGVCCIDELNTMKEHDRTSLHEAMEQQTISVAKAGMVSKVSTKCTVLAATNAKQGGYNPEESLSANTSLGTPLLSRFDLVFVMRDTRSQEWDSMLSSFILGLAVATSTSERDKELWSAEDMQMYLAYARTYMPKIGPAAHAVLTTYYQSLRAVENPNAARTTVRMLESLIRLSQGHARLMLRHEVTTEDAVVTISLMECSMGTCALSGGAADALRAQFPADPLHLYRQQAIILLKKLNLDDILGVELARLDELEGGKSITPAGVAGPLPLARPPDHALSQRLNTLITGIRRKKDLESCQAAGLHVNKRPIKRTLPRPRPQTIHGNTKEITCSKAIKRKRKMILSDSENEEEPKEAAIVEDDDEDVDAILLRVTGQSTNPCIPHADFLQDSISQSRCLEPTKSVSNEISNESSGHLKKKSLEININLDNIISKRSGAVRNTLDKLQKFKKTSGNATVTDSSLEDAEHAKEIDREHGALIEEQNERQDIAASFKSVNTSTPLKPDNTRTLVEFRHQTAASQDIGIITPSVEGPCGNSTPVMNDSIVSAKPNEVTKIKALIQKSQELSQKSERWSQAHVQSQSRSQSQFTLNDVTWENFLDDQVNLDF